MAVTGLNNLILVADDIDKAVQFYDKALGLTLSFTDGGKWAQMKAGAAKVGVSSPDEAGEHAGGAIPVFEIDDLAATRAAVLEHGGEILSERDMGSHGHSLAIRDVSGNILQLIKR